MEIVWGLREMRTGGSEARYPGIEVSRFPRFLGREPERVSASATQSLRGLRVVQNGPK